MPGAGRGRQDQMEGHYGFTVDFAAELARSAGRVMREAFGLGMERSLKDDGTHLTEADTTINRLVLSEVGRRCPGFSILAEEGSADVEGSDYTVVCDPIDGTTAFCHGIPTCVFSLALVHRGVPVIGVIYDPFMDRLFFAEVGRGAFLNERPIRVSGSATLKGSVIGPVWWRGDPFRVDRVNEALMDKGARTIDTGSVAYMGALVAAGAIGGTVFPGRTPWDTAAMKVIVEEAGGQVTDVFGDDQRYDREIRGHVASNRVLHSQLLEIIAGVQDGGAVPREGRPVRSEERMRAHNGET